MVKLLWCFAGLLLSLDVCRANSGTQRTQFWAEKLWAEYSPYAPAGPYKPPPQGCSIKQVNLVSNNPPVRVRFPNSLFSDPASRS